ncbi:MAG: PASTA domain-containing protein [Deltaproteobacteria bacterium]|nr:PASTA domain-containing protein [Deltaproteobacteria bacterium]
MTMKKVFSGIAISLALASCSLIKTSTSIGHGTSPSGGGGGGGGGGGAVASSGGDITMPSLLGLTEEQAAAAVKKAGFTQDMEQSRPLECENAAHVEGEINCQDPEPGATVKPYALVQVNVYHEQHLTGMVVRRQLLALIGKSPDQAKALLKSYGHTATVKVEPGDHHYDQCGEKVVCAFDVAEAGIGVGDPITLYVNPGVTLTAPPPE